MGKELIVYNYLKLTGIYALYNAALCAYTDAYMLHSAHSVYVLIKLTAGIIKKLRCILRLVYLVYFNAIVMKSKSNNNYKKKQ